MLVPMLCKRCPKCGETKAAATGFYAEPTRSDGYSSKCRTCFRRYYQANRDRRLAYQLEYRQKLAAEH